MRKESGSTNLNTYITDHLPTKFQEQRKVLLPYYKEAKKNKKKTIWKALDGNYTLFIENEQVDLMSRELFIQLLIAYIANVLCCFSYFIYFLNCAIPLIQEMSH